MRLGGRQRAVTGGLSRIKKEVSSRGIADTRNSLVALRCLRNHIDRMAVDQLFETAKSRLAARGADFQAGQKHREHAVSISPNSEQATKSR